MLKKMTVIFFVVGSISNFTYAANFNLDSSKKELINDNVNIAIAYENYIGVTQNAQVKALQILPTITVDMLITSYQYTILRSVIPEPARFFDAAAAKNLAKAADDNQKIVKKNMLQDLEEKYFLHQFHKEVAQELSQELAIRKDLVNRAQEAYDLGSISFGDFYSLKRELTNAQSTLVSANEIVDIDELALKLILQENDLSPITLDQQEFYNQTLNFPTNREEAANSAVNNSLEVAQWDHLIEAATNAKRGVEISWLSWNGVGFDYFARVKVAKTEIDKIKLNRTKTVYELKNQIALAYSNIDKQYEKIELQKQLLTLAEEDLKQATDNYNNQLGTVITLKRSELYVAQVKRDLKRLNYEQELLFIKLKRLLGANLISNQFPKA